MVRPRKQAATVFEVRKSEESTQNLLRRPLFNVGGVEAVIHDINKKFEMIYNLDPEPEKPLPIKLNLDQLEDSE